MLLPRTHGRRNDHSSDRGVDDACFRRLSRSRGEKKMLQLVQRVSCAATSSLSMWLRGCCLLVARQEEAALEKTPAEAGRALWYVLRASTARCWRLQSCRRRRRCTNRRRVFSEANACIRQRWILLHPLLHVQWHNCCFTHTRGTLSCALDSRSVV